MGASLPAGAIPPTSDWEGPETRRQSRMKRLLRRMYRLALLVAFLGLLAAAPAIPTTGSAWAKPYPQQPGPEPTNGDPTGDDRPSPTPKPVSRISSFRGRGQVAIRDGKVIGGTLEAWSSIIRYLMAITLR